MVLLKLKDTGRKLNLQQVKNQEIMKNKVFIIAELSANHNGDINIALESVRAAKRTGADAVKIQTYTPDTLTINCKNNYFKINHGTAWDGEYLYDLYKRAYTPWEWHKEIFKVANEEGIICFSSPFDTTAVDLLEELNVPVYKICLLYTSPSPRDQA